MRGMNEKLLMTHWISKETNEHTSSIGAKSIRSDG